MTVKLTLKQRLFLIFYPFLHVILCVIGLFMTLSTGLGPDDPGAITTWQKAESAIGQVLIYIFWAPVLLMNNMGLRFYKSGYIDYLFFFLSGIPYAAIMLAVYKKVRKYQSTN